MVELPPKPEWLEKTRSWGWEDFRNCICRKTTIVCTVDHHAETGDHRTARPDGASWSQYWTIMLMEVQTVLLPGSRSNWMERDTQGDHAGAPWRQFHQVIVSINLAEKLETVHFFVIEEIYKFSRGSNHYLHLGKLDPWPPAGPGDPHTSLQESWLLNATPYYWPPSSFSIFSLCSWLPVSVLLCFCLLRFLCACLFALMCQVSGAVSFLFTCFLSCVTLL